MTTPRDVQAGWYAWRTAQDYVILHHGNRPWVHPARMPMSAGCLDAARICGGLTTIVPMRRSSEVAQAARVTA